MNVCLSFNSICDQWNLFSSYFCRCLFMIMPKSIKHKLAQFDFPFFFISKFLEMLFLMAKMNSRQCSKLIIALKTDERGGKKCVCNHVINKRAFLLIFFAIIKCNFAFVVIFAWFHEKQKKKESRNLFLKCFHILSSRMHTAQCDVIDSFSWKNYVSRIAPLEWNGWMKTMKAVHEDRATNLLDLKCTFNLDALRLNCNFDFSL